MFQVLRLILCKKKYPHIYVHILTFFIAQKCVFYSSGIEHFLLWLKKKRHTKYF